MYTSVSLEGPLTGGCISGNLKSERHIRRHSEGFWPLALLQGLSGAYRGFLLSILFVILQWEFACLWQIFLEATFKDSMALHNASIPDGFI